MATLAELRAKLTELEASESETTAARAQYDTDAAAEQAAITKTTESRSAWIAKLVRQHEIDDEYDALNADYEPPAVPT